MKNLWLDMLNYNETFDNNYAISYYENLLSGVISNLILNKDNIITSEFKTNWNFSMGNYFLLNLYKDLIYFKNQNPNLKDLKDVNTIVLEKYASYLTNKDIKNFHFALFSEIKAYKTFLKENNFVYDYSNLSKELINFYLQTNNHEQCILKLSLFIVHCYCGINLSDYHLFNENQHDLLDENYILKKLTE